MTLVPTLRLRSKKKELETGSNSADCQLTSVIAMVEKC